MGVTEIALYERTRREYGTEIADGAYEAFSFTNADKYGIERAWTIAVNRALEVDRFYAHETGAVRRTRWR